MPTPPADAQYSEGRHYWWDQVAELWQRVESGAQSPAPNDKPPLVMDPDGGGMHPRGTLWMIHIWFKSYIPQEALAGPPGFDCFLGDNRGDSPDPNASARVTSHLYLTNLDSTPQLEQEHHCGTTHQVKCSDHSAIAEATASADSCKFFNLRYPGATVWDWSHPYSPDAHPPEVVVPSTDPISLDYVMLAGNPLVPLAPQVDMNAHIEITHDGFLDISGAVDAFPAFEGYASINEGPTVWLFSADGNGSALDLVGDASRPISVRVGIGGMTTVG